MARFDVTFGADDIATAGTDHRTSPATGGDRARDASSNGGAAPHPDRDSFGTRVNFRGMGPRLRCVGPALLGTLAATLGCQVEGGTADAAMDLMDGDGPESGALCAAAPRALPGAPFYEGGSSCVTSDGQQGRGKGNFGCVPLSDCFPPCLPAQGSVECLWVSLRNSLGTEQFGARCVFKDCSGANENELCHLSSGGIGLCCSGSCSDIDYLNDPENCGGCGFQCAPSATCRSARCSVPCNVACGAEPLPECGSCAAGKTCQATLLGYVCLTKSCLGLSDGAPCSSGGKHGMCCDQDCKWVDSDSDNCGDCGVHCCAGNHCSPGNNATAGGTSAVGVCL
jgi:hypothetical protein